MNKQAKTMKKQAKTVDKRLNKQAPRQDDGTDDRQESRTTQWEQWVGVVERGLPHTLLLYRLDKKATKKSARTRAYLPGRVGSHSETTTDRAKTYFAHRRCESLDPGGVSTYWEACVANGMLVQPAGCLFSRRGIF